MCIDPTSVCLSGDAKNKREPHPNSEKGQLLSCKLIKKLCMRTVEVDIFCFENNALKAPKYACI